MGYPRNGSRFGSTVGGAVLLAALLPVGASAAAQPTGAEPSGRGEHCNFDARSEVQRCFGSATEAQADARAQDGKLIVGTFFRDTQYGGGTFTVYGESLCDGNDETDQQINLPDEWKDTVSSLQPWAKCKVWLYSEPDLGGDVDGPYEENTPDVGKKLNDRAQSIGFS